MLRRQSIPPTVPNEHLKIFFFFSSVRPRCAKWRNLGAERNADLADSYADVLRVAQRTRRTPAEFCMRSAQKPNKICDTFARFLAEICARSPSN